MMLAMGGDFHFEAASHNFKNLDKLIKYMNENTNSSGINVLYSTPSCYAKSLNEDGDGENVSEWTTKTDDFFPYCDEGSELNVIIMEQEIPKRIISTSIIGRFRLFKDTRYLID